MALRVDRVGTRSGCAISGLELSGTDAGDDRTPRQALLSSQCLSDSDRRGRGGDRAVDGGVESGTAGAGRAGSRQRFVPGALRLAGAADRELHPIPPGGRAAAAPRSGQDGNRPSRSAPAGLGRHAGLAGADGGRGRRLLHAIARGARSGSHFRAELRRGGGARVLRHRLRAASGHQRSPSVLPLGNAGEEWRGPDRSQWRLWKEPSALSIVDGGRDLYPSLRQAIPKPLADSDLPGDKPTTQRDLAQGQVLLLIHPSVFSDVNGPLLPARPPPVPPAHHAGGPLSFQWLAQLHLEGEVGRVQKKSHDGQPVLAIASGLFHQGDMMSIIVASSVALMVTSVSFSQELLGPIAPSLDAKGTVELRAIHQAHLYFV